MHPRLPQKRSQQGQAGVGRQPDVQRLRVQQPVGLKLRQTGVEIQQANLKPQPVGLPGRQGRGRDGRPPPGIDRPRPVRRQEAENQCLQRHQVIVVEVGADIHQLGVGEQTPEGDDGHAIEGAQCHHQGTDRDAAVQQVQAGGLRHLHPAEAPVLEVERRLHEEPVDPSLRHEAQAAGAHQQAEQHAVHRQRGNVEWLEEPPVEFFGHQVS